MITGLNHITLAVADIDRSFSFYVNTLKCRPIARWRGGAYVSAGGTWLALVTDDNVGSMHRPDYSHIAFTCTETDIRELAEALDAAGCVEWSENRSEGSSYYFCDPDGHKLEIHVGDLGTRLRAMREKSWAELEFFPAAEDLGR